MINSAVYIIEIKVVYESFSKFLNYAKNERWQSLLDLLMEIQIIKLKNTSVNNKKLTEKLKKLEFSLKKLEHLNNICADNVLNYIELNIIEELDKEAFKEYIKSKYYIELETIIQKFNSKFMPQVSINN